MVEDVERDESQEVDAADEGKGKEETALDCGEDDRGDNGNFVVFLHDSHVGLLLIFRIC